MAITNIGGRDDSPDVLLRVMPMAPHAGDERSSLTYAAAAYLVERVEWLSSFPNQGEEPVLADGSLLQTEIRLDIVAEEIHSQTPPKTQERRST